MVIKISNGRGLPILAFQKILHDPQCWTFNYLRGGFYNSNIEGTMLDTARSLEKCGTLVAPLPITAKVE